MSSNQVEKIKRSNQINQIKELKKTFDALSVTKLNLSEDERKIIKGYLMEYADFINTTYVKLSNAVGWNSTVVEQIITVSQKLLKAFNSEIDFVSLEQHANNACDHIRSFNRDILLSIQNGTLFSLLFDLLNLISIYVFR